MKLNVKLDIILLLLMYITFHRWVVLPLLVFFGGSREVISAIVLQQLIDIKICINFRFSKGQIY